MILAKWCKNGATKSKFNQHIQSLNPNTKKLEQYYTEMT
jgi:hypothetical protein